MLYDYSGVQNSFQSHLPVKNKKKAFMKISPCGGLISGYVLGWRPFQPFPDWPDTLDEFQFFFAFQKPFPVVYVWSKSKYYRPLVEINKGASTG